MESIWDVMILLLCERARIHLIDIIELFSPEYHFILFIYFVWIKNLCTMCNITKVFEFYIGCELRIGSYWLLYAILQVQIFNPHFFAVRNHDRSFEIRICDIIRIFVSFNAPLMSPWQPLYYIYIDGV